MRHTSFFIPPSDRPDIVTQVLKGSPYTGPQLSGCSESSGKEGRKDGKDGKDIDMSLKSPHLPGSMYPFV